LAGDAPSTVTYHSAALAGSVTRICTLSQVTARAAGSAIAVLAAMRRHAVRPVRPVVIDAYFMELLEKKQVVSPATRIVSPARHKHAIVPACLRRAERLLIVCDAAGRNQNLAR